MQHFLIFGSIVKWVFVLFKLQGDSSVFVLSRTGHFEYSPVHNSLNINGRNFILHLPGSCHICVSMCDQIFFVNYFNWLIYS